jgi:RNA-directed DNA polymerase
LGNLTTPKRVQKLQMALHAKAKTAAGYRFYTLYDKISREDILAHAYAQCRSNKGAPGVDGQDFADIEAYGVERWLAELALALREETYRLPLHYAKSVPSGRPAHGCPWLLLAAGAARRW